MAYSTGSGSSSDMMAAVLSHAVGEGWIESGGIGTGWPISKGNIRGIDFNLVDFTENDNTPGLPGGLVPKRDMRLGLGSTPAEATSLASTSSVRCPNFIYDVSQWYIFSDASVGDHIHVVFQFSNGVNLDCFGHFSFGEIDKGGMSYGSVAYATTKYSRAYAVSSAESDWNDLTKCGNMWSGSIGEADDGSSQLAINVHSTDAPCENGVSGWPSWDVTHQGGDFVWGKTGRQSSNYRGPDMIEGNPSIEFFAWAATPPSFLGSVTLMPIPFILINSSSFSARLRWLGTYPNVRKCSVEGFSPGDEVSYGGETWVLFPTLRSTDNNQLRVDYSITSGRTGFAYKKVI